MFYQFIHYNLICEYIYQLIIKKYSEYDKYTLLILNCVYKLMLYELCKLYLS